MSQKTIWKYAIPITDHFEIEMPRDAHILCVQTQDGEPTIWALVNPYPSSDIANETRTFSVVGTGRPADHVKPENYIGTFQIVKRVYQHQQHKTLGEVWHLFEIKN